MAKTFGKAEHRILNLFRQGTKFTHAGIDYTVIMSGKPTCRSGEPKTDIYILAQSANHNLKEFKISFKKNNADFLENKIKPERAEQLFGDNWCKIISNATYAIRKDFLSRMLIYKSKMGRTDAGAITLGWKFELLRVLSGQLSGNMLLSRNQVLDVYAGTNLTGEKKDATVNGKYIPNSGIANYLLFEYQTICDVQNASNSLVSIEQYVTQNPNVYFACKALNYRTFEQKYDGNRPLAVYVDWHIRSGKLASDIRFDTPLQQGGDYVYKRLKTALHTLGVSNTNDLNFTNVENPNNIFQ